MQVLRSFPAYPSHVQTVDLGGVAYRLQLDWSERLGCWRATLSDGDGVAVVTGVRVEPGADLLEWADPAVAPDGALLAFDAGGCGTAEGRSTVTLTFAGAGAAVLLAGSVCTDTLGQDWVLVETLTKGGGAAVNCRAEAVLTGAVEAEEGTITTHPFGGGVTCTNRARAVVGAALAQTLQADLGAGLLIVFIPTDEFPAVASTSWTVTVEDYP